MLHSLIITLERHTIGINVCFDFNILSKDELCSNRSKLCFGVRGFGHALFLFLEV